MREVMDLRDARQNAIASHPFFGWLHADHVPLEERLTFAPMAAFFVMQFRDMNRWVLRFPEPRDEYEWIIDAGTWEDEKHSHLFLEDWRKLALDQKLGWKASDMLWWLFLSEDQEVFRRSGMEFISLAVEDADDALVRFGHSEAGEATGHVMLDNTSKVATALSERTGLEYRYFGKYHLDLESGHVANTEGVFEEQILDSRRRVSAMELCGRMFDLFERIFDGFMTYAHTYIDSGTVPRRSPSRRATEEWTAPPLAIHPADHRDVEMARLIEERKARVATHPFYGWLSKESGLSPLQKLQRFIPMWMMDVLGYRDLNKYAMSYTDPENAAQQAINAWASRLSTHSDLFLADWDALGLDTVLGFSASETLEFIFLDTDMDLHREHMIEFAKLAHRHSDPAVRWWMMTALESTGEAFFAHTRPLARVVEETTNVRLDYLCGRHDAPQSGTSVGGVDDGVPPASLNAVTLGVAQGLVNHVFDAMDSQLWRSLAVARANKFAVP